MKNIDVSQVTVLVKELCIKANCVLPEDVKETLVSAVEKEESELGKNVLGVIIENYKTAQAQNQAICQDTGAAVIFCEIGQDVHFEGGNLQDAINEGVRQAYKQGYFRNSIVQDPLIRNNTGDNTPSIIHYEIVAGDKVKITVAPKGFGSENMSALRMLKVSDGTEGIIRFIVETVENAAANPCPPIVIGVGIGGTMEKAALIAKKALLRPMNSYNESEHIAKLEKLILDLINDLGIGPEGLGGRVTALKVNIETYPTHIAGLPVAINICCHANRHADGEL